MSDMVCRGSYILGSACGECSKCEKFLIELLRELTDNEVCSYDHHGYCQTHFLSEKPCPNETAIKVFEKLPKGKRL